MSQQAQPLYSIAPDVVFCELQDRLVLLDTRQGTYFSLNPVAALCWELLARPHSLDDLTRGVAIEYSISEADCRDDITQLLTDLAAAGLVEERVNA